MQIIDRTPLLTHEAVQYQYAHHNDQRGYFTEWHSIAADLPLAVQANESYSRRGVFRGMHYQPGMGKLVRAMLGSAIDLLFDMRLDSPTYGQLEAVPLTAACVPAQQVGTLLWIPPGVAHGFVAREDVVMVYLTTAVYQRETERAVRVFDFLNNRILPDVKVPQTGWVRELHTLMRMPYFCVSERDRNADPFTG